jgi:hypothetical protein
MVRFKVRNRIWIRIVARRIHNMAVVYRTSCHKLYTGTGTGVAKNYLHVEGAHFYRRLNAP